MEHVSGNAEKVSGCLFEPKGDKTCDKDALLLLRSENTIVLLNRFPYTNGHLLIAPIRHIACITELLPEELHHLMEMVSQATEILRSDLSPDGFNVGCNIGKVAGAGIADHLHFHIVPRWENDHNFMTVLADIRSIPEHLNITYDKLLPAFQKTLSH
jgi:ATP adenylyltransferase